MHHLAHVMLQQTFIKQWTWYLVNTIVAFRSDRVHRKKKKQGTCDYRTDESLPTWWKSPKRSLESQNTEFGQAACLDYMLLGWMKNMLVPPDLTLWSSLDTVFIKGSSHQFFCIHLILAWTFLLQDLLLRRSADIWRNLQRWWGEMTNIPLDEAAPMSWNLQTTRR